MSKGIQRTILTSFMLVGMNLTDAVSWFTPSPQALGRRESGASVLQGYLVEGTAFLPLKKFADETGFHTWISPTGRNIMVIAGSRSAMVGYRKTATLGNQDFSLSMEPFKRDADTYVPLDFYERVFPAVFKYDPKRQTVLVELPTKTLRILILPLANEESSNEPRP